MYGVGVSALGSPAALAAGHHGPSPDGRAAALKSSVTRTTHLYHSTKGWPRSTTHHSGGAINLTEEGDLQRFVNRSHSPRPKARHMLASRAATWVPRVTSTPVTTPTHPGRGWEGLNENDNQNFAGFNVEPPDQGLCAGGGYVFEMINDVVQTYSTSGTPLTKPVYLNTFFGEKGYQFATDPSCVFDAGSHRFYALMLNLVVDPATGNLTGANRLDLAVSKSSDPRAGWNFYRIQATDAGATGQPHHRDCPCIGDFPHLATDANGVYITTNEYPFSGKGVFGNGFNGAQLYALSKSAVAAGAASTRVVHFQNLRVPSSTGSRRLVGFTVWPSMSAGTEYATANSGTEYFTSSFAADEARPGSFSGNAKQIGLWWLSNTRSLNWQSPRLSLHVKVMNSEIYGVPPLSKQKPGPTPLLDCLQTTKCFGFGNPYEHNEFGSLDSSDSRILSSVYSNGHVITELDTAMDVAGNVQAGFAWFDIAAQGTTSHVSHQGYVGNRGNNVIFPAMATNPAGDGVVGVTLVGNRWYPSHAYLRWNGTDLGGIKVAAAGKAPEDGFCEYAAFSCAAPHVPRPRWGDYGAATWDGHNFYVANEYIAHRCSFDRFMAGNHTCGGTRTFFGNFSTHIQRLRP
jgi:hypothetical protein